MGVDTKAILPASTSLVDIAETIKKNYGKADVISTYLKDYFQIVFTDGEDNRNLSVFFGDYGLNDYGIPGVCLSLSLWGNSIDIMKTLLDEFGGYLDENDCDDKDFYLINSDKFNSAKSTTDRDLFKQEIISKVGYNHLNTVLELFEKYKNL